MSAVVRTTNLPTYTAICRACAWEGKREDTFNRAEVEANRHNRDFHEHS